MAQSTLTAYAVCNNVNIRKEKKSTCVEAITRFGIFDNTLWKPVRKRGKVRFHFTRDGISNGIVNGEVSEMIRYRGFLGRCWGRPKKGNELHAAV